MLPILFWHLSLQVLVGMNFVGSFVMFAEELGERIVISAFSMRCFSPEIKSFVSSSFLILGTSQNNVFEKRWLGLSGCIQPDLLSSLRAVSRRQGSLQHGIRAWMLGRCGLKSLPGFCWAFLEVSNPQYLHFHCLCQFNWSSQRFTNLLHYYTWPFGIICVDECQVRGTFRHGQMETGLFLKESDLKLSWLWSTIYK